MKCLVTVALLPVCCSLLAAQALHTPVEGKPAAVRVSDYVSSGGIRWEPVNPDVSPDANPDTPANNPKKNETGVTLTFPVLDVYSPQGELVCHASSQPEIERLIARFPRSVRHLHPILGADTLDEVYRKFPALAMERPITPGYTFLSLKLESCEACDVEAGILAKAQHRLESQHVHVQTLVLEPQ